MDREKNLAAFLEGNDPIVPHVMYHGSKYGNIEKFEGFRGTAGHFAFDPKDASSYANQDLTPFEDEYFHKEGPQVYPVHLSAKKVFDARNPEHVKEAGLHNRGITKWDYEDLEKYHPLIKKAGFDSYLDFEHGPKEEPQGIAVFHPHQIKSATGNNGNFDPNEPDIRKADGGRAAIKLAKSLGGKLEKRRAQTAKTRAGGQQLPASRYMPEVPRQVRQDGGSVDDGITAYHGSPHDFDQFDMSKIGTGEGAQARGHGMYFAESEPVAKSYRDRIALNRNQMSLVDATTGEPLSEDTPGHKFLKSFFDSHAYDMRQGDRENQLANWDRQKEYLQKSMKEFEDSRSHPDLQDAASAKWIDDEIADRQSDIEGIDAAQKILHKVKAKPIGHMYEVHIDAHPDHFLDWDKPISQQSEHVGNAIKSLMHLTSHERDNMPINSFYEMLGSPKEASERLHGAGVHGIKYLDAGSRGVGKGTRNYVVFDDKRVNVKRKYEQGGSVHGDDFIPHDDPQRQANLDAFDPIRDENGAPRVFYHGTKRFLARPTPDIQAFKTSSEMGAHFGNQAQAHDTQFVGEDLEDEGQIYPVHLSIKNPIRLRDLGRFTASNVASQLRDMGHDIPKDIGSLDIQNYLKSIGHDGVVYLNRREGLKNWKSGMQSPMHFNSRPDEDFKKAYPEAEDSYIAFDANQAKSAIGNKGTFDKSHPHLNEARGGAIGYKEGGVIPHDDMQRDSNLGKFLQGSKVRNGQGDHVVLYHITPKNFDQFKAGGDDPELSGPAIWLSPNKDYLPAAHNVQKRGGEYVEGTNVMPVYANIKSPLVLDNRTMIDWARNAYNAGGEFPMYIHPNVKQALIDDGYDGIFWGGSNPVEYGTNDIGVGEQPHGEEEVIAFHPHQIKSATGNNGNFDPKKPSINEARGGSVGYADGGETQDYVEQQRAAPTRAAFREKIARQNEQENPMLANFYKQTEPFGGREIMSPLVGTPMGIQPRSHDQFLNMMNVEREKRSELPAHEARANAPTPVKEPSYMDELAFALEGVKRHGASFLEDLHRYANEDLKKRMQEYSETLPTAEENVRYLKEKAGNALSAVGDFIAPPAYAHGGNVSHRPHYGFGGEGEGPIAGATGSATERNTPENTGMSDSGSDTTNNSGNGNDNGGGNGRDMREGNVFGPTEGDVPGMSAAALDYNRKVDAMQAENNSLFSSGAKDTATNPFLSGVRQMTSPQAQSDLTRLDSAINYPLIGGMIGNAYGVQQATPQQEAQIAGVINDMRTPQTVPANFGTPEGMLSRYGYPMGTTPQRAGSMGSMPTSYTTYGSNLNPVSSVGPRAGSMGSMPESSFQDASGNVPMPPERPSAMMDMSSSVGRATPAQQPQMNGVSSARSDFNRAFAEARSQGKQQFPWTNPFTGQQGMYRVAYNSGGRALYPSQIVEHVLNKISAPPPALDPMMVAKRGRP